MDWYPRKKLGWRLSNTMEVGLCLETLAIAVAQTSRLLEVLNTDKGSQFTSQEWTGEPTRPGIAFSMGAKGRWMDNVFIERLWRSAKHENVYLREYASLPALDAGIEACTQPLKSRRPPRQRRASRREVFEIRGLPQAGPGYSKAGCSGLAPARERYSSWGSGCRNLALRDVREYASLPVDHDDYPPPHSPSPSLHLADPWPKNGTTSLEKSLQDLVSLRLWDGCGFTSSHKK